MKRNHDLMAVCVVILLGCICSRSQAAEAFPAIKLTNLRRLPHNGQHNAFTDLTWFQGEITNVGA